MFEEHEVRLLARAKVNLFLAVGARRPDGYHDVTTVLQAIELADEVAVSANHSADEVRCTGLDIAPSDNLASAALDAWRSHGGQTGPVSISISKNVPAGAGLAGGSSDAAAVLEALSELDALSDEARSRAVAIAATVGADVPFFLGPGTQVLGGRGDVPVEVLPTPDLHIVLVNGCVPVSTAAAYAAFDLLPASSPVSPDAAVAAICSGDPEAIGRALHNNMTAASVGLVPEIGDRLEFLEASEDVLGAAMCGSGSCVFGICRDSTTAQHLAKEALARGWWASATRSVAEGVALVK